MGLVPWLFGTLTSCGLTVLVGKVPVSRNDTATQSQMLDMPGTVKRPRLLRAVLVKAPRKRRQGPRPTRKNNQLDRSGFCVHHLVSLYSQDSRLGESGRQTRTFGQDTSLRICSPGPSGLRPRWLGLASLGTGHAGNTGSWLVRWAEIVWHLHTV